MRAQRNDSQLLKTAASSSKMKSLKSPVHFHRSLALLQTSNENRLILPLFSTCKEASNAEKDYSHKSFIESVLVSKTLKVISRLPDRRQRFHTSARQVVEYKIKASIKDCYTLLEVDEDSTDEELKSAYLSKAKAYHPDSATTKSDPHKFSQVKDAYKAVLEHRKGRALKEEEEIEADTIFDIKHTAPQHRQYLEFEGVGFGTPSQRQKQYQQHRVSRVTENIFQHRIQKLAAETEDSLVVKDKQQAKKSVISNAIDRIVEDMIQESIKRGDFNNLPGQGRPLEYSAHNPFIDISTHNINKILVNNGFAPEWIMLQSEIRKEMQQARQTLAVVRHRMTNFADEPLGMHDTKIWRAAVSKFRSQVEEVNIKINKFNLIVPFLNKQKVPYMPDKEVNRVVDNVKKFLPQDSDTHVENWDVMYSPAQSTTQQQQDINWKEMWDDIKQIFKFRHEKS